MLMKNVENKNDYKINKINNYLDIFMYVKIFYLFIFFIYLIKKI